MMLTFILVGLVLLLVVSALLNGPSTDEPTPRWRRPESQIETKKPGWDE